MNDNSSMEPEEKMSAVSMHKVSTGTSVDSMVSCRELVFNLAKATMNIIIPIVVINMVPFLSNSIKITVLTA